MMLGASIQDIAVVDIESLKKGDIQQSMLKLHSKLILLGVGKRGILIQQTQIHFSKAADSPIKLKGSGKKYNT